MIYFYYIHFLALNLIEDVRKFSHFEKLSYFQQVNNQFSFHISQIEHLQHFEQKYQLFSGRITFSFYPFT